MSCFAGCDEPDLSPLPECPFDVVVVTAPNARAAKAYEIELPIAFGRATAPRGGDAAPAALLLSVADPMGRRVGSGGGTLNALDAAATALEDAAATHAGAAAAPRRVWPLHRGGAWAPLVCSLYKCEDGGGERR